MERERETTGYELLPEAQTVPKQRLNQSRHALGTALGEADAVRDRHGTIRVQLLRYV
jgi:hypothetical protein